eukprot:COSAG06_NODE_11051_length_1575_cov_33.371951_1_plen_81_part_00
MQGLEETIITKLALSLRPYLGLEGDCVIQEVRKTPFWRAVFTLEMIILPRQAPDRHRKALETEAFCAGRGWRRYVYGRQG